MKKNNRTDHRNNDYNSKEARRIKRRRIRRIVRLCITVISVVLTLVIVVAVLRLRTLRAIRGDYVRSLDITDQVVARVAVWLNDVEGAEVDAEWIREKTQGIYVDVELSFTPEGLTKGSFTETLNAESCAAGEEEAYRVTGDCLRELIVKRLTAVGYTESLDDEEADKLITGALGMPIDSYLKNAGIDVAPDYNELAEKINRSGEYKIRKMTIEWTRDGMDTVDAFSVTKDTLAIHDAGYVYTRVESNDEKE